ncbi:hypothetical protein D3C71_1778710 [compost metagenome]
MRVGERPPMCGHRGQVDDRAVGTQCRNGPTAQVEHAVEVDAQRLPPLLIGHLGNRLRLVQAGRWHQEVDAAEALDSQLHSVG